MELCVWEKTKRCKESHTERLKKSKQNQKISREPKPRWKQLFGWSASWKKGKELWTRACLYHGFRMAQLTNFWACCSIPAHLHAPNILWTPPHPPRVIKWAHWELKSQKAAVEMTLSILSGLKYMCGYEQVGHAQDGLAVTQGACRCIKTPKTNGALL